MSSSKPIRDSSICKKPKRRRGKHRLKRHSRECAARTMAMQHSGELGETSFLLAKQVRALDIQTWGCAFSIFDEDQKTSTEWFSNENGYLPTYKTPREGVFLRYYEAAQRGESLHVEEFEGETCVAHYKYLSTLPVLGDILKKIF